MRALLRTGMSLPEQKEADTVLHTQLDIHNTCTGIFSVLSWSTFFYLNLQKKKKKKKKKKLFVDFFNLAPRGEE